MLGGGEVTPYSQVRALHYGMEAAGAWWVQDAGFAAGHTRSVIRSAMSITIALTSGCRSPLFGLSVVDLGSILDCYTPPSPTSERGQRGNHPKAFRS